mmetsp:Transcript_752/g.1293  ORF Transcript_752/g.1293 Transcript_752/m.1293 type:complete len:291 (+) Transcript_752:91-963(+)
MTDNTALFYLDKERKDLEEEASAITSELTASVDGKDPMGISTPLVDKDGYPRADVDVYRARYLRKRLHEIRFDHDVIMKKIEEQILKNSRSHGEEEMQERRKQKPKPKFDPKTGKWVVRNWDGTVSGITNGHLYSFDEIGVKDNVYNESKGAKVDSENGPLHDDKYAVLGGQNSIMEECRADQDKQEQEQHLPFAKVGVVMSGSPAQEAGLKNDDLIIKFGTVDYSNNRNLQALPDIVRNAHSDGHYIVVVVSRVIPNEMHQSTKLIQLKLRPKEWSRKGLIGCTFEPVA